MDYKAKAATILLSVVIAISSTAPPVASEGAPQRIEITAERFHFNPAEVTLKKGLPVVLVLTSKDVTHGLKVKELNINVKARKGEISEVSLTPTQTGDFAGVCSVFCGLHHGSMRITFHVTE